MKTLKTKPRDVRKAVTAAISCELFEQVERLVKEGWYGSQDHVIEEALTRFIENHRPELIEKNLRNEVERVMRG